MWRAAAAVMAARRGLLDESLLGDFSFFIFNC